MSEDEEIVQAFLEESRENLDQLDRNLVILETRPADPELLAQVFRAIHTIKGTCGFLGFSRLEALTHAGEDLLDALRSGKLAMDSDVTTSLLRLIDAVRAVLGRIDQTGDEGEETYPEVIAALASQLVRERSPHPMAAAPSAVATEFAQTASAVATELAQGAPSSAATERAQGAPSVTATELPQSPPSAGREYPGATGTPRDASESSVRVDVGLLDRLMDLVGELVLARSQIGHAVAEVEEGPLAAPYRQLVRIIADLQENVMRARLQPIGAVTGKFPRIARDLAASMDKRIRVELDGEDVGVDRAVNEVLRDVLLHLVRNTVDHGIEPPAERVAAGKDPEGCLRIRASHAGGRVRIELADDGRGADPLRLAARAVSAGLITRAEADALSASSCLQLMFLPGLSTKEHITTVSGRGVGMDAVRAKLDQLGAAIEVSSHRGRGTTFSINVPLTLAILPTLLVCSGGERYALALVHVREVLHLDPDEVLGAVDDVDGARIHRLRGRLLPLVTLAEHLRVAPAGAPSDGLTIVVADVDGRSLGIVVDAVGETIDAVVKPLPQAVRSITMFAGVMILSDGRPALIVDLAGLAAAGGVGTSRADAAPQVAVSENVTQTPLLLATADGGGRLAVALSAVRRLELFRGELVQPSRGGEVVEYGGAILPLMRVAELLPGLDPGDGSASADPGADIPTIVCDSSGGPVGLVVGRIEDVVARPLDPPSAHDRQGASRRLMIGDRVTELIDVEALVAGAETRAQ